MSDEKDVVVDAEKKFEPAAVGVEPVVEEDGLVGEVVVGVDEAALYEIVELLMLQGQVGL